MFIALLLSALGSARAPLVPDVPTDLHGLTWEIDAERVVGAGRLHVVVDRDGLEATWGADTLRIEAVAWGRRGQLDPLPTVAPELVGDRVQQLGAGISRWVTREAGTIEQGWVVAEPPAGEGPLVIELGISAEVEAEVEIDGEGARLRSGQTCWRYDGLLAYDADHRRLPARMVATAGGLAIEVQDAGARWPVVIDPNLSAGEQKLTASDGGTLGGFADALDGAGDLNGDGYDDLVIGAHLDDDQGDGAGAAYVYYGSSTGIDAASEQKIFASDGGPDRLFATVVKGLGDVNADGYADLVLSSPYDGDTAADAGAVYLYLGSAAGLDASSELKMRASDGVASDYFGYGVGAGGDINGDGYADLLVGSLRHTGRVAQSGSVYLYFGSPSGLDITSEQGLQASDGEAQESFAFSLAGVGDTDGDGFDDLIVGASTDDDRGDDSGSAYVYRGSSAGADASTELKLLASNGTPADTFGWSVAGAGDVDGDGYADVVIGSGAVGATAPTTFGAAYVYRGSASGIDPASELEIIASDATFSAGFGDAVDGAGDLDADGFDDLVVGADTDPGGGTARGAVYVYYGSASGPDLAGEVKIVASDGTAQDWLGYPLAGVGDVDADGLADLAASAPGDDTLGSSAGAVYVYYGVCADHDGDGACEDDCDDRDAAIHPSAIEACNGLDDNCDGRIDEAGATGESTWFADEDGDGFGDAAVSSTACGAPAGYGVDASDCDDDAAAVHPGATEVCNGVDDDCDGTIDGNAVGAPDWYVDQDGDGWTVASASVTDCEPPDGYATSSAAPDCDDGDASAFPGADELPGDGIDQDCDGLDPEVVKHDPSECGCSGGRAWAVLGLLPLARRRRSRT